jgi:hypothetical protein
MTQEKKDIILHHAKIEMMNACINFDDGTCDRGKMIEVMQRYAEMYHINELSKLHQRNVSQSVCIHDFGDINQFSRCLKCGII